MRTLSLLQILKYIDDPVDLYNFVLCNPKILKYLNIDELLKKFSRKRIDRYLEYNILPNGERHLSYRKYNMSGVIVQECAYYRDRLNGEYIERWNNGNLKCKSYYNHGKKDGKEMRWDERGKLIQTIEYKDGDKCGDLIVYFKDRVYGIRRYRNGIKYNILIT